ncbi:LuxR C-terminal-related transcriptional regulator [Modestobacter roseus]|uniref:LuxR C-terminal-related transcriptional regulator n=1 Tax=Modestobacter roseus TaxID=1181884 RepID=UPI00129755C6|nr:hypothetical protein [Modestobacter roseus]
MPPSAGPGRGGGPRTQPTLTPQELELLRDLPAQLTMEDIAARHQLSVNTVTTHVRAIYRTLDARSRRAAVASARRRGLLRGHRPRPDPRRTAVRAARSPARCGVAGGS